MSDLTQLVRAIVASPAEPEPIHSLEAWADRHRARTGHFVTPIDRAILGGFVADRLGYAFASGYREALVALAPGLGADGVTVLSATEEGGAKPSAIRTSIDRGAGKTSVSGKKRWATLATLADWILVAATDGTDERGRNRLKMLRIPRGRAGITVRPMAPPPFAPEIPHAEIELDRVEIAPDEILPGDGWDDWLKPFRTVEDVHVHGALAGYLGGVARRHRLAREFVTDLVASIVAIRGVALEDPRAAEVHLALAGVLDTTRRVVERLDAAWQARSEERDRWERDRALLSVAGAARELRREAAFRQLESASAGEEGSR